jgi:DNA-binding TFAR19-related protein (PDSD5 family)
MDDEIEFIKRKKMVEYMQRILERQMKSVEAGEKEDIYEKVKPLFTPDGFNYLISIRDKNPGLADKILKNLLFLLINGLASVPVDKLSVEILEKKLSGYKGKIYVEKKGELKEFGEALKEDED